MTGYGKGEFENDLYKFKIEIKSINHRYNDILVKMPRHIISLEDTIKKRIKEYVQRGKVDVFVNLEYINESTVDISIDTHLARSYKLALEGLVSELALDDKIRLNNILAIPEVVKIERKEVDEDLISQCLNNALEKAIESLINMRTIEGDELKNDILIKLNNIEDYIDIIEERSPMVSSEYQNKLELRIKEILGSYSVLDEERLNNEVAYFIDKSSIDEEAVRLRSHIKQFKSILNEDEPKGRKLDFLIQEFNREINTIGSKSNDEIISNRVVELKAELEKIREQVQNIE